MGLSKESLAENSFSRIDHPNKVRHERSNPVTPTGLRRSRLVSRSLCSALSPDIKCPTMHTGMSRFTLHSPLYINDYVITKIGGIIFEAEL